MKRSTKSGFTLVEVMVTLLIMSLMMIAITQVLQGARRTRDLINNVQESQLAGPAILDLVEADLRGIFTTNRQLLDVLRVQDNAIGGIDSDRIDFVTSSNSRLITPNAERSRYLRADVSEVGYCVKPNLDYRGDFVEIWRREDFGVDNEPFSGGRFTFLHDRVVRFDIQVFDEDGLEAEPLEVWGMATADEKYRGLPARIEIELELELAPRLISEAGPQSRKQKRRVSYRRMIHFPKRLHTALEVRPVPRIPIAAPTAPAGGDGGTGGGADAPAPDGTSQEAPAPSDDGTEGILDLNGRPPALDAFGSGGANPFGR